MGKLSIWLAVLTLGGFGFWLVTVGLAAPFGYQAVPRDAFPVFDNPKTLPAAEAEAKGVVFDRDMVIGVARGREAKAYPITIMGVHELGNDVIDGVPIAVTW
jgi:hypothetical protein